MTSFRNDNKIISLKDSYDFAVENTPTEEMRVITPYRLVGAIFTGVVLDANFWTSSTGTGGSNTVGNSQLIMSTGTTANNSVSVQSVRTARYVGGSANRLRIVFRFPDVGTTNNIRRFGAFTTTDGAFFELNGTTFSCVVRKTSNDTKISNGSFNGKLGSTITINTSCNTFEIYWTNSKVWFVVNGSLLHTFIASSTTWSDTLHLPCRLENTNSNNLSTNILLNVRTVTISRLGSESTAPISKYQSGTTSGIIYKYGVGSVHQVIISNITNNSVVTIYDGTSTDGTILWASGAMSNQTVPFSIPFISGLPFYTGLFLTITVAACNVTIIYE